MSLVLAGCVVVLFSALAFWRSHFLLFMVAAGASAITGLYWYDTYTNKLGLAISLMLLAYSLICLGFAFRLIFWRDRLSED